MAKNAKGVNPTVVVTNQRCIDKLNQFLGSVIDFNEK